MSRRHAQLTTDGQRWWIEDLASTNGTKVNGRNITDHPLADGDEILLGATTLRYEKD